SLKVLALEDDLANIPPATIRVRAIHAASGVGSVNVLNVPRIGSASVLYESLAFGNAGAYMHLPSAAYRIGLDVDGDHRADLLFQLPHLPPGTVANIFASANAHGAVELICQLNDSSVVAVPAE